MKKTLLAAAVLSAGFLFSAEIFKAVEPADFVQKNVFKKTAGGLSIKAARGYYYSAKRIAVDPAKKYRISGEFRFSGTPYKCFQLGYIPADARKRWIPAVGIHGVKKTETTLAAAAKKGDTVLKVTDASAWNNRQNHPAVAFNIKDNLADLPNFDFSGVVKGSIKKVGNVWEITLAAPLKKAYAAGTRIRQHFYGGTYIYNFSKYGLKPQTGWQKYSAEITGETTGIRSDKKFWTGTKTVQVLLLVSGGGADSVVELRNFKVEEVK